MKIIFITLARIDSIEVKGIYPDLLRCFRDNGHDLTIVCPNERKYGNSTRFFSEKGVKILNVWTTNIQKTNIIEKGFTTLFIEFFYFFAIRKFLNYKNTDLIIYSTPPITLINLILWLKKSSKSKTYLLLKDIFPQNAVDLNLIKKSGILYKYFRSKEKTLYEISDHIGCMSPANIKYVLENNLFLNERKLEVNPNTIQISRDIKSPNKNLLIKYGIPENKIIFLFGGNLGLPQGINLLTENISYCKSIEEAFFLIVGDGTEYDFIEKWLRDTCVKNAMLIRELPRLDYDEILQLSHVGLIFLNPLFTIPNFPSRILSYMQCKLPIICATDPVTDIGQIVSNNNFGFSCLANDFTNFRNSVVKLLDKSLRYQMGENAFLFLENEYNVEISYKKIVEKLN